VEAKSGKPKTREFITYGSLGFGTKMGVHNHSLQNVRRALVERVYKVEGPNGLRNPPKPVQHAFDRLRGFRARLLPHLASCRRWTDEEFILSYTGAKQERVRAAGISLTLRALQRRDARLSMFVKAEKLNLSKKPDPAPRAIQPRDARYNFRVGPYIKALEHRLYQAIDRVWGGPTVMKGLNARQTARALRRHWDSFRRPVAIGLDASRLDQHVSAAALEWEHSVYNAVYRDADFRKWLTWQLDNHGLARTPEGVVRYFVRGCRMSGDMNTSAGNCLLMCAMVWAYCQYLGIHTQLANNGDDCVVFMEAGDAQRFRSTLSEWFLEMGFTMKIEDTVDVFERIEFCQCHPVWADGWVMSRNPHVVMDKDLTCLHPESMPYRQWLASVGKAGLALASGVPVLQPFYEAVIAAGEGSRDMETCGMSYLSRGLTAKSTDITTEARLSFWRAFGILPHIQEELEESMHELAQGLTEGVISGCPPEVERLCIQDGWS